MALKQITPPAVEPISLAEAKLHCSISGSQWDSLVTMRISAARAHLDGKNGKLGRALVTQTWELQLDAFPCGAIALPLPPLQSITSVKYLDTAGVEQTMPTIDYVIDTSSEPGWVAPATSWPSTFQTLNAVKVRFVAGYGAAVDVPDPLKLAMLLMISDLMENREASIVAASHTVNPAVESLIFPYRVLSV